MANAVYVFCAITSAVCAVLLLRKYRANRVRLLFWAALCFIGLTFNNVLLVLDFIVYPGADLAVWRGATSVGAIAILLYGLIWDTP